MVEPSTRNRKIEGSKPDTGGRGREKLKFESFSTMKCIFLQNFHSHVGGNFCLNLKIDCMQKSKEFSSMMCTVRAPQHSA